MTREEIEDIIRERDALQEKLEAAEEKLEAAEEKLEAAEDLRAIAVRTEAFLERLLDVGYKADVGTFRVDVADLRERIVAAIGQRGRRGNELLGEPDATPSCG